MNVNFPSTATIYKVGGCVRDTILGVESTDTDFVVVGVSPQSMLDAGFQQVGADFPVFLHPETHDEYALARTERKSGQGYHGFSTYAAPDVTLEEDLSRRDFTMNAMAQDPKTGAIIDPFNGQEHMATKVLRHVGPAFAEDPVRVLRGARFAAKYDFDFHADTWALMQQLVDTGEMKTLVPERVRVEFEKGFVGPNPVAMWEALERLGTLDTLVPPAMAVKAVYGLVSKLPAETDAAHLWGALLHAAYPHASLDDYKKLMQKHKYPSESVYVATTLQNRAAIGESPTMPECVRYWTKTDAKRQTKAWPGIQALANTLGWSAPSAEQWLALDGACRIDEASKVQALRALGGNIAKDLPNVLFDARVEQVARVLPGFPLADSPGSDAAPELR